MENKTPYLIDIGSIGSKELGFITVAEVGKNIPFKIKRVYWTYNSPPATIRGHHAHKTLHQVICSVHGVIVFNLENKAGDKLRFVLDHPSKGLYIPPMHWRTIELSSSAVLLCLASEEYDGADYFRDYNEFKENK
jgi:hypothetical protein